MPNKLLVVDAYALLYRGHYAFGDRPLMTSDGRNTSAIFGFLNTLLSAFRQELPTHAAVVFDPKGGSFRHDLYAAYKANRPPSPEGVKFGAMAAKSLLPLLGISVLEEAGYEADDLAGSLVERFADSATEVVLLSPDKDYQQLLGPFCSILKPKRGNDHFERITEEDLKSKYGISEARQYIDILALSGDASDNVPGVPGIGEKTAATLISKYGSIEWIFGNVGSFTPKMSDRLCGARQDLSLWRTLITISREAPVPNSLDALRLGSADLEGARASMEELEFNSLAARVLELFGSERSGTLDGREATRPEDMLSLANAAHEYRVVESDAMLEEMLSALSSASILALDTETTGLSTRKDRVVGISFSTSPFTGWYAPVVGAGYCVETLFEGLRRVLSNPSLVVVGHNLKFDMLMLKGLGIEIEGVLYDTMLLHYLLDPDGRHGLDGLAEQWLGYRPIRLEEVVPDIKRDPLSILQSDVSQLGEYAIEDADVSLRLYSCLWPRVEEMGLASLYMDMERPLLRVLADMEWQGVAVDLSRLSELRGGIVSELSELSAAIRKVAGDEEMNIDSPRQVGALLFDKLGVSEKPKKTKTGQYDTSEGELQKYSEDHPVVRLVLDYRERKKLLSTYVDALPRLVNDSTGRVHAHFNQAVAGTGRLSSSNPNMQNIPVRTDSGRAIRSAFVSDFDGGVLISADYSQIELRLMAHMSQDRGMIEAFGCGEDIHRSTAAKIFGVAPEVVRKEEREYAKRANFGMVYGISAFGLSQQLRIGVREADQFIKDYFALYPAVEEYMRSTKSFARAHGYVQTLWGRKRWIGDINSGNQTLRLAAERNAINAPIQGSAADIIKRAMVRISEQIRDEGLRARLVLQVHDELIVDSPFEEQERVRVLLVEGMSGAASLSVPLVVDVSVGVNWGEL